MEDFRAEFDAEYRDQLEWKKQRASILGGTAAAVAAGILGSTAAAVGSGVGVAILAKGAVLGAVAVGASPAVLGVGIATVAGYGAIKVRRFIHFRRVVQRPVDVLMEPKAAVNEAQAKLSVPANALESLNPPGHQAPGSFASRPAGLRRVASSTHDQIAQLPTFLRDELTCLFKIEETHGENDDWRSAIRSMVSLFEGMGRHLLIPSEPRLRRRYLLDVKSASRRINDEHFMIEVFEKNRFTAGALTVLLGIVFTMPVCDYLKWLQTRGVDVDSLRRSPSTIFSNLRVCASRRNDVTHIGSRTAPVSYCEYADFVRGLFGADFVKELMPLAQLLDKTQSTLGATLLRDCLKIGPLG